MAEVCWTRERISLDCRPSVDAQPSFLICLYTRIHAQPFCRMAVHLPHEPFQPPECKELDVPEFICNCPNRILGFAQSVSEMCSHCWLNSTWTKLSLETQWSMLYSHLLPAVADPAPADASAILSAPSKCASSASSSSSKSRLFSASSGSDPSLSCQIRSK